MLADEEGRNKVGSGSTFSDAVDDLLHQPKKGTVALDQYLDYGGILFVGDAHYNLRQVISRDRHALRKASNTLVAELKHTFEIPHDLHTFVGWRDNQDGPCEGIDLSDLLGRSEKERRLRT